MKAAAGTLLDRVRDRVVNAPDTVCLDRARLVTEAYRHYDNLPVALKRARAFAYVLERMTLDTESNPYFAGNTSTGPNAWMLLPEYSLGMPGLVPAEVPGTLHLLDGDAVPADIRAYWEGRSAGMAAGGIGHLCADYAAVLGRGLRAIADEAEAAAATGTREQGEYRQAMAIGCRAVIAWAGRYTAALEERAADADDRTRALLLRSAAACRRVPAEPARDLYEALQSMALVHLAIHIEGHGYSVAAGLLDRLLLPYYHDDPDAEELLAAFMLKLTANSLWGSHSKTQTITLGGMDADGRDRCNPLTGIILRAWERVRVPDPMIFLRWHRNLDPVIRRQAAGMLTRGLSMPLLLGDGETVAGLVQAGITAGDAAGYCIVGCNELGIPGKLLWDSVRLNSTELLRRAVCDPDVQRECTSPDRLLTYLAGQARTALITAVEAGLKRREVSAEKVPTPFTSALMHGSIGRGADLNRWMHYDRFSVVERGFTNFINGLTAVNELVFERRIRSMGDIARALQDEYEGHAALRSEILAAPKWGNDDDRADRLAVRWLELRDGIRRDVERETGCRNLMFEHVVRSLHHIDGNNMDATPDGRRKGEPLADSIGAMAGTLTGGPTALLNSMRKLRPATYWTGGYNLNMALPLSRWDTPAMTDRFVALVDAFFNNGGQELQVNCLDREQLLDAQVHPEKYPELIVRIAGFSALFVKLTRREQDEIVGRAGMNDEWRITNCK